MSSFSMFMLTLVLTTIVAGGMLGIIIFAFALAKAASKKTPKPYDNKNQTEVQSVSCSQEG